MRSDQSIGRAPVDTTPPPRESLRRSDLLREHLERLWPDGLPEGAELALWRSDTKGTVRAESCEAAVKAWGGAEPTLRPGESLYLATAAFRAGTGGRKGSDAIAVPALAVDVDLAGGAHAADDLPTATEWERARGLLAEAGLPISLELRSSRGGRYALALLDAPFEIECSADRARIEAAAWRFEALLRGLLAEAAGSPRSLDPTSDLARLLRPAGAINAKPGNDRAVVRPVGVLGRRFSLDEIEERLDDAGNAGRLVVHGSARGAFDGELPEALPDWIAKATEGLVHRIAEDAGRVSAVVLRECPSCGRGSKDGHPAHVSPIAGALRCKRATCAASGDGLAFEVWAPLAGVSPDRVRETRRARRLRPSATPTSSEPVTTREAAREALRAKIAAREGPDVWLDGSPTGAGKTETLVEASLERSDLALLFRDYTAVREFLNRRKWAIRARGLEGVPELEVRMGLARGCQRPEVRRLRIEADIASLCGRCELRGACPATRALRGRVVVTVHDAFEKLQRLGVLEGRVVLFDEDFDPIVEDTIRRPLIEREIAGAAKVENKHLRRDLDAVARWLRSILEDVDAAWAGEGHAPHLGTTRLAEIVKGSAGDAFENRRAALERVCDRARSFGRLPALDPDRVLRGDYVPEDVRHRREVQGVWHALRQLLDRHEPKPDEPPPLFEPDPVLIAASRGRGDHLAPVPDLDLVATPTALVVRRVRRIDRSRCGRVIVASADARTIATRLRAANPGLNIEVDARRPPTGGRELFRYAHGARSRRSMLDGADLRTDEHGTPRALKALRGSLRALRAALTDRHGAAEAEAMLQATGVLAFKGVSEAFQRAPELLEGLGAQVTAWGHWNLHDRGTTRFERCRVVVLLGDNLTNIGSNAHDARVLGIEPDVLLADRAAESLAQACGRLRAEWGDRPGAVLIVGDAVEAPVEAVELEAATSPSDARGAAAVVRELLDARVPVAPALVGRWVGPMGYAGPTDPPTPVGPAYPLDPKRSRAAKQALRRQANGRPEAEVDLGFRAPVAAVLPRGWDEVDARRWAERVRAGQTPLEAAQAVERLRDAEIPTAAIVRPPTTVPCATIHRAPPPSRPSGQVRRIASSPRGDP